MTAWPFRQPVRFEPSSQQACVRLRPAAPPEGPAVVAQTLSARALLTRFRHVYVPPTRPAPLALGLLLDLEIPSPTRCRTTLAGVQDTFASEAATIAEGDRRGAPVVILNPVQVATTDGQSCRQSSDRSFDAASVAQSWVDELRAGTAAPTRLQVVYVANLALPPSPVLQSALTQLLSTLEEQYDQAHFVMGMGPQAALEGLPLAAVAPWISTLEPGFPDTVAGLLGRALPFESLDHTSETDVPLLTREETEGLVAWRPCTSSFPILPQGLAVGNEAFAPLGEGPVYRVALPEQQLVPSPLFRSPSVELDWEGCFGLCARPPAGAPEASWLDGGRCRP